MALWYVIAIDKAKVVTDVANLLEKGVLNSYEITPFERVPD